MPVIRIDENSLKILHEVKDKILIHNKNRGITGRVNLSDAIRSLNLEKLKDDVWKDKSKES